MKTSARFLTGLLSCVLLANASATILLNEIHARTPLSSSTVEADSNFEFVELKSTTGAAEDCVGPNGGPLWLLLIDNDGNGGRGGVDQAWKLVDPTTGVALKTGANGLLLLGDDYLKSGSPYATIKAIQTAMGDPSGMGSDNLGNDAYTMLLVEGYTEPAPLGADTKPDFDKDDNGLLDWIQTPIPAIGYQAAPWTVLNYNTTSNPAGAVDSVGYNGDVGAVITPAYCGAGGAGSNLSNSNALKGVTATGFLPHSVARGGTNNTANSRTAWYGGISAGTTGDSVVYGASVFNLLSGQTWAGRVTPGQPNLSAAPVAPVFRINEIHSNPPGTPGRSAPGATAVNPAVASANDGNFEYIEIINTSTATDLSGSLAGYALLMIDNGGGGIGEIVEAWDLSKFSTGSNGILMLGDGFTNGECPWAKNLDPATQLGDPEAVVISATEKYSSMSLGDIPNDGVTFLLVTNFTNNVGLDIDADDNIATANLAPYTVIDGVSIPEINSTDRSLVAGRGGYSAAQISVLVGTSRYAPDNLSRIKGSNTASSAAAWSYGALGSNSPYALTYRNGFFGPATFRGAASPGKANFSVAAPPTVGTVRLNEVHVNPPTAVDNTEYVELISSTAHASMKDLWLIVLDASAGASSGIVKKVIDLRAESTGANRLAVFADGIEEDTSALPPFCSGQTLRDDPALYYGDGTQPASASDYNFTPDSLAPNSGVSILLVSYTAPTATSVPAAPGADLDANDDGVLDAAAAWTLVDGISTGNGIGAAPAVTSGAANVSRVVGNLTANSLGAWFGGDITGATATSFDYGATYFGTFKGAATPGRHNPVATPNPAAVVLINEVNINPPGADNNKEFVELRTADNTATGLPGYSLILVDNEGADIGRVLKVYDLDSAATGTNGLLLAGSGYDTLVPWTAAAAPEASTAIFAPDTMAFDDIALASDNGAFTLLLVKYFNGRLGDDLDMGSNTDRRASVPDDGIFNTPLQWSSLTDSAAMKGFTTALGINGATNANPIVITTSAPHGLSTGASVTISGVGGNTNANGVRTITVVTSTTFQLVGIAGNGAYTNGGSVAGAFLLGSIFSGTTDLTVPIPAAPNQANGYTPDTVARFANKLTPNDSASWYGANITGTAGTSTVYSTTEFFPDTLTGGKVTPGQINAYALTDLSDPDGDGVVVVMEDALGMDIFTPDTPKLPQPEMRVISGQNAGKPQPVFVVTRPSGGVAGITYEVEASTDLVDWSSYTTQVKTTTANTPSVGMETKVYGIPAAFLPTLVDGRIFYRLRVTR